MSRARAAMLGLALCAGCTLICILFIDRPVALFVAHHQQHRLLFQAMAAPSLLPLPFAIVFLSGYVISAPFAWPPGRNARNLIAVSLAILGATTAKDELKWLFGRPWPDTWLHYGAYGFQPFTDSFLYGAYPSGHTSYIAAPMCLLCWLRPKYRPLWLGVILLVMVGLVGAGYHFVGDVVGGFFTGLAAAAVVAGFMSRQPGARNFTEIVKAGRG
jgi:membrane-associated phospholipid phosphatase